MKKICVEIEGVCGSGECEELVGRLRDEGVEVCRWAEEKEKEDLEHMILLTDRGEMAEAAAREGVACVGYEAPGAGSFSARADMVVQGLEELDAEFFRLVYRRHHGLPWRIAETERLLIRESASEDFDAIYGIYMEPGTAEFMPGMSGAKEEERELFEAYIGRMYPFFSYGLWTVIEKESGNIIGRAGLENGTYMGRPVLEIGYMLGRDYRGRGYGLEAVRAIAGYGFSAVGAKEIYAFIREENARSLRLIRKAGFCQAESERAGVDVFRLRSGTVLIEK